MALRFDPVGAFNFYLSLIDSSNLVGTVISLAMNYFVAGFSECSGIEASLEVMEYKQGGMNDRVLKFPTRASHSNITMKHGIIYSYNDLWNWHHDFVRGAGARRDGLIFLLDEARKPVRVWKFKRGIPTKWVGPSLNATQNNVALESLEIAHEGLQLTAGG